MKRKFVSIPGQKQEWFELDVGGQTFFAKSGDCSYGRTANAIQLKMK